VLDAAGVLDAVGVLESGVVLEAAGSMGVGRTGAGPAADLIRKATVAG